MTVTGSGTEPQADPDVEERLDALDALLTNEDVVVTDWLFEDVDVVVVGVGFEDVEVVMMGVLFEDVVLVLVDELLTMLVLITIVELTDVAGQLGTSGRQLVIVTKRVLVNVLVEGALSGGSPYCPFAALVSRATDRAERAHDGFASSITS